MQKSLLRSSASHYFNCHNPRHRKVLKAGSRSNQIKLFVLFEICSKLVGIDVYVTAGIGVKAHITGLVESFSAVRWTNSLMASNLENPSTWTIHFLVQLLFPVLMSN